MTPEKDVIYSADPKEPKKVKPTIYTERGAVDPLIKGETILVRGIGNSMVPLLKSGQVVTVAPLKLTDKIKKGDIVLCKVMGDVYMHKVTGISGAYVQISNNHGHVNGWTPRDKVYGRYTKD